MIQPSLLKASKEVFHISTSDSPESSLCSNLYIEVQKQERPLPSKQLIIVYFHFLQNFMLYLCTYKEKQNVQDYFCTSRDTPIPQQKPATPDAYQLYFQTPWPTNFNRPSPYPFSSWCKDQVQVFQWSSQFTFCQQKYNNMADHQTLTMQVNTSNHINNHIQSTQFKQNSVKDQSINVNDFNPNTKQLKQQALLFLNQYHVIDQNFMINKVKQSPELKVKFYKESVFYGNIHNGKKHGLGILVYNNGRVYQGQWVFDCKKGFGSEKFPNGSLFKGQYLHGKPNGTGTYIWGNGQRYDGQWVDGFKHGSGMWRGQKGDSFKGQWKFGKPDGYGVHTWPNGDTYEGQFKDCLKHGEGIERFANGDIYKGHYLNGKPSGYGQYFWFNGSFFKGNFMNGLRQGKGVWRRGPGNNDHYQGSYRNDKKNGYGIFTWASGNIYKGNYELDMRNGYGQMFWKNGSYYKGNWANGIQHGEGKYIFIQGEIFIPFEGYKKGRFDNNQIVQVWQQQLVQKHGIKKPRMRIRTQPQKQKIGFKSMNKSRTNQSTKKRMSEQTLKRKQSPPKQKKGQLSLLQVKQFKKPLTGKNQKKILFQDKQTSYPAKYDIFNRQRVNTYCSQNQSKQLIKTQSSHCSKSRLLHSSFYLYKLNQRHQSDTNKHFRRTQTESKNEGRGSVLFMGKLYPQTK